MRRNLGQGLRGNPDINTGKLSNLSRPRIEHLAELGIAKCHRQRRLNGTAYGLSGIGVQTGRYINRHNGHTANVHAGDERSLDTSHCGIQPRPKQGVNDHIAASESFLSGRYLLQCGHFFDATSEAQERLQVALGIASDLPFFGRKNHLTRDALLFHQAGHDKAVAAVIASAGDHNRSFGPLLKKVEQDLRRSAAGPFHQDMTGGAIFLNCEPIKLTHLGGRDEIHEMIRLDRSTRPEVGSHGIGDFLTIGAHQAFVFTLDHDPEQRLSPGIADEEPSSLAQFVGDLLDDV